MAEEPSVDSLRNEIDVDLRVEYEKMLHVLQIFSPRGEHIYVLSTR